jgi:hypothetical protein
MSFNESNKFQEMKSIIDDVNNILVELKDEGISMSIEPSNDIRVKMASIRDGHFYIDFLRLSEPWPEVRDLYPLIFEKIHMLIDYLDEKGFYTEVSVKTYSSQSYERAIQIEELESNLVEIPAYRLSFISLKFFHNDLIEYNESNKFQEMKSILQDIKSICVELADENLIMDLEPSINNDIRIKMATIKDGMFSLHFIDSLNRKQDLYPLIIEKILMISEYLLEKGYNTNLKVRYYFKYPGGNSGRTIERDMTSYDLEELYNKHFDLSSRYKENGIFTISTLKLDFDRINKEVYESLPNQRSVDQLERVMKISAKTDIGNRISDMNKQGANIHYIQNPIDSGIESREEYDKHNKSFRPSWNLKHLLGPFAEKKKKNKKK